MEHFEFTIKTPNDSILFVNGAEQVLEIFQDYPEISQYVSVYMVADGTAMIDGSVALKLTAPIGAVTPEYLQQFIYALQHRSHVLTQCIAIKARNPRSICVVTNWHPDEVKCAELARLTVATDPTMKPTQFPPMKVMVISVNNVGSLNRMMFRAIDRVSDLAVRDILSPFAPLPDCHTTYQELLKPLVAGHKTLCRLHPKLPSRPEYKASFCPDELDLLNKGKETMIQYELADTKTIQDHVEFQCTVETNLVGDDYQLIICQWPVLPYVWELMAHEEPDAYSYLAWPKLPFTEELMLARLPV